MTEPKEGGGATVSLYRSSSLSADTFQVEGSGSSHCPQPHLEDSSVYRQNRPTNVYGRQNYLRIVAGRALDLRNRQPHRKFNLFRAA